MEEQLQRPAAVAKKMAAPEQKAHHHIHVAHAGAGKCGGEAPAVMVTTPKESSKHAHLLASSRACLCSPTTHAGSFRCRLHRGGGGGAGLHEMGKKPSPGA